MCRGCSADTPLFPRSRHPRDMSGPLSITFEHLFTGNRHLITWNRPLFIFDFGELDIRISVIVITISQNTVVMCDINSVMYNVCK